MLALLCVASVHALLGNSIVNNMSRSSITFNFADTCVCLTIICSLIRCSSAAAKEAPLRSRAGQLDGMDSLLHWGDGQLDLARSTFLPGSPLVLSASWVDGSAWQACTWTLPGGEVWRLEDGQVVDETGDEVEGAESWGDSQAVCGIRISTSLEQVGHCTMTYAMSIDILEVYKSKNSLHAHFILKVSIPFLKDAKLPKV